MRCEDSRLSEEYAVIYDRSFMSVILFQKYMKHLAISGQFDAYEYAKVLFKDLLLKNQIMLPDFLVFVRCQSAEIYNQRQNREISVDFLRGEDARSFFEDSYRDIFEIYDKFNRALELKSNNTESSLRENTHLLDVAIEGINQLDDTNRKIIIERIMENI